MYHPSYDHPDVAAEICEFGLMAAASPEFAEALVRALLEQPAAGDSTAQLAVAPSTSIAA